MIIGVAVDPGVDGVGGIGVGDTGVAIGVGETTGGTGVAVGVGTTGDGVTVGVTGGTGVGDGVGVTGAGVAVGSGVGDGVGVGVTGGTGVGVAVGVTGGTGVAVGVGSGVGSGVAVGVGVGIGGITVGVATTPAVQTSAKVENWKEEKENSLLVTSKVVARSTHEPPSSAGTNRWNLSRPDAWSTRTALRPPICSISASLRVTLRRTRDQKDGSGMGRPSASKKLISTALNVLPSGSIGNVLLGTILTLAWKVLGSVRPGNSSATP